MTLKEITIKQLDDPPLKETLYITLDLISHIHPFDRIEEGYKIDDSYHKKMLYYLNIFMLGSPMTRSYPSIECVFDTHKARSRVIQDLEAAMKDVKLNIRNDT